MTPTLQHFIDELAAQGVDDPGWRLELDERPHLVLDPLDNVVGPLEVWDDTCELTLVFGKCYHCHFDGCESDLLASATDEQRLAAAASLTAEYVARILDSRIGVAVHYRGDTCIGAALIYLDDDGVDASQLAESTIGLYGGNIRTERFLWSGPVPAPQNQNGGEP
ncbi:hypothetical protein [Planctomycetes bacterium TBK1r]|uniref:YbjN domain-containing protein n=1 Tax=Stieleria magnilauensis TaxID=2527963 RepID=A0ABX5Y4T5_9BACT|nr:hypothetical protein TBK1r_78370 [Planctomycetes bacterium TBK1r]